MVDASLFRAKRINHCNDFVARVALEVVDSFRWKQQLRVKSAGSRTTALPSNEEASRQPYSTSRVSAPTWCPRQSLLQYSVRFPFGGKVGIRSVDQHNVVSHSSSAYSTKKYSHNSGAVVRRQHDELGGRHRFS